MDIETTVPCAPIGTAAIRMATNIASKRKKRNLNAIVFVLLCECMLVHCIVGEIYREEGGQKVDENFYPH